MTLDKVDVLKIDKDCHVAKEWIDAYPWLVLVTCQRYGVKVISVKMCRSRRKGIHFYIEISPPVEAELANRIQWLLGDDHGRVGFNQARIESSLNEWNKLFELPNRRLRTIYRTTDALSKSF